MAVVAISAGLDVQEVAENSCFAQFVQVHGSSSDPAHVRDLRLLALHAIPCWGRMFVWICVRSLDLSSAYREVGHLFI